MTTDDYARRYRISQSEAALAIERRVLGSDFGASSYTTRDQADALVGRLRLTPESRLLDVGAGRGWPGLYIAEAVGCRAVLTDIPVAGLRTAAARARRDDCADRCHAVAASADAPAFAPKSFDAVVHSDVLC